MFVFFLPVLLILGLLALLNSPDSTPRSQSAIPGKGRLTKPAAPSQNLLANRAVEAGIHPLQLATERDALLYVPPTYRAAKPAPLLVIFHGGSGNPTWAISLLRAQADEHGLLLLAPWSQGESWDIVAGDGFGADINFLNSALVKTFENYAVEPTQTGVAGFSDGATYALSVGLTNGDFFSHILAFSPGFMRPAARYGLPPIYISHGVNDNILPIAECSRKIVPRLEALGYQLRYREFEGNHSVPSEIATDSINWFLAPAS